MNEKDWYLIKILREEGTITGAAKRLYLSQPAVTRRLRELEGELGAPLFVRGPRRLELTAEGQVVARYADQSAAQLTDLLEELRSSQQQTLGLLRIHCGNVYSKHRLPRLLRLFHERFPRVDVQVNSGVSQSVFRSALYESGSVAVIRGNYRWPGPRLFLGRDSYFAAAVAPFAIEDLPHLPQIRYHTDRQLQDQIDGWWFSRFEKPPRLSMNVDSADTCLEMIREGLGYSILSELSLEQRPDFYRHCLVFDEGTPLSRHSWLCYRKESLNNRAVNAFVEFMHQEAAPCETSREEIDVP